MLWACLRFPELAVEVFERSNVASTPLIVVEQGSRPSVVAANRTAMQQGICIGMTVGAALALVSHATIKVRNPALETDALKGIAIWAEQFAPLRSLANPAAVLIEIGGCLSYFGGLRVLLKRMRDGIDELGYRAVMTVAPTATGTLLFNRAGFETTITDSRRAREALCKVPIQALDYSRRTIDALEAIGVKSIGDCRDLPRDGVARRYGQALLDMIDRAMGDIPDPQKPFVSPETYSGKLMLPAPIWDVDALLFGVKRLTHEMCGWLAGRYHGVAAMRLDLLHEDVPPTYFPLNLSTPTRTAKDLILLWRERLSQQKLPDRVVGIGLLTIETVPLDSQSLSLLKEKGSNGDDIDLLDRLRARLGDDAVSLLHTYADHRPESAWKQGAIQASVEPLPPAPRPIWFLTQPTALKSVGNEGWILLDGPERIEAGWWDGAPVCRDYYVARNPQGQTVWVFRDWRQHGQWFLQGLFA